ncbi:Berberine and berberine like [Tistlia consotensis]|uniref:Berberine and berberine like n=1 Tax=Tistlia consotensis USBA 355 TaxID=560819 RepID=A0A1Y6B4J5_9PROT|nr:FAD-binding protein [Tistlia consotensis]SME88972.1 Berberine and berberine like [Tistlia consotensis USBA 355]SNR25555.1 Berberine and berberine like [Tistlia consotensis]
MPTPSPAGRPPILSDRQGFNRRWFAPNLAKVFTPASAAEVAAALDASVALQGQVKVASGRHCYESFVYSDQTRALIDLSGMKRVGVDESRGFYVEAGASNWDAYLGLLTGYDRTLPAGSCYSVGAGGHICGGGYGLLSRLHGLTVDHLTAVELAVKPDAGAPARIVTVDTGSRGDEALLYWASRGGGGGNFGIITRYYFEDPPAAPSEAALRIYSYDWEQFTTPGMLQQLLDVYTEQLASQRPETWNGFALLKLNHRAVGQINVIFQQALPRELGEDGRAWCHERAGAVESALAAIAPLRPQRGPLVGHVGWLGGLHPSSVSLQWLTYYEALQTLNGSGPNQRGKYKSAYMRKGFPAAQTAALFEGLQVVPPGLSADDMKQTLVQVDTYGGAINRLGTAATPVPQRDSILKLQYQTYWNTAQPIGAPDDARGRAQVDYLRGLYQAVYAPYGGTPDPARDPAGVVDGCYYNYPDVDLGTGPEVEQALWLYFKDNYRSHPMNLRAAKRAWDPNNFFRHAQSIPV